MADPKLPAAKRRLTHLLHDVEYGPKLARLNRADERIVLDLIYENRGREARRRLDELDAARRTTVNTRTRARKYARLGKIDRIRLHPSDETTLFWRHYDNGEVG